MNDMNQEQINQLATDLVASFDPQRLALALAVAYHTRSLTAGGPLRAFLKKASTLYARIHLTRSLSHESNFLKPFPYNRIQTEQSAQPPTTTPQNQ